MRPANAAVQFRLRITRGGGSRGGGTRLTPLGERVIRLYRSIEAKAAEAGAADLARLTGLLVH